MQEELSFLTVAVAAAIAVAAIGVRAAAIAVAAIVAVATIVIRAAAIAVAATIAVAIVVVGITIIRPCHIPINFSTSQNVSTLP